MQASVHRIRARNEHADRMKGVRSPIRDAQIMRAKAVAQRATYECYMRVSATMGIRREEVSDVNEFGPHERGDEVEDTRHLEENHGAVFEFAIVHGLSARGNELLGGRHVAANVRDVKTTGPRLDVRRERELDKTLGEILTNVRADDVGDRPQVPSLIL